MNKITPPECLFPKNSQLVSTAFNRWALLNVPHTSCAYIQKEKTMEFYIFKRFSIYIIYYFYYKVCVCPAETRLCRSPGGGGTGFCESADINTENQTQILCKSSPVLNHRASPPAWNLSPFNKVTFRSPDSEEKRRTWRQRGWAGDTEGQLVVKATHWRWLATRQSDTLDTRVVQF